MNKNDKVLIAAAVCMVLSAILTFVAQRGYWHSYALIICALGMIMCVGVHFFFKKRKKRHDDEDKKI